MDLKRYREVIPNQASQEKVKDIVLNTGKCDSKPKRRFCITISLVTPLPAGGSQSTLQDIKVTEHANGYCYKYYKGKSDRNRFIYW